MLHAAECADAGEGVADLWAGVGLEDSATGVSEGTGGRGVCVGENASGELLSEEKTGVGREGHELGLCVVMKGEALQIHGGVVWRGGGRGLEKVEILWKEVAGWGEAREEGRRRE